MLRLVDWIVPNSSESVEFANPFSNSGAVCYFKNANTSYSFNRLFDKVLLCAINMFEFTNLLVQITSVIGDGNRQRHYGDCCYCCR